MSVDPVGELPELQASPDVPMPAVEQVPVEGEPAVVEERQVLLSRAVETATAAPGEVRALSTSRGSETR